MSTISAKYKNNIAKIESMYSYAYSVKARKVYERNKNLKFCRLTGAIEHNIISREGKSNLVSVDYLAVYSSYTFTGDKTFVLFSSDAIQCVLNWLSAGYIPDRYKTSVLCEALIFAQSYGFALFIDDLYLYFNMRVNVNFNFAIEILQRFDNPLITWEIIWTAAIHLANFYKYIIEENSCFDCRTFTEYPEFEEKAPKGKLCCAHTVITDLNDDKQFCSHYVRMGSSVPSGVYSEWCCLHRKNMVWQKSYYEYMRKKYTEIISNLPKKVVSLIGDALAN